MIKEIVKDTAFLCQKSTPATADDLYIGQDLRDTLAANKDRCVGMAANMVGYLKNIIIFEDSDSSVKVMYNPKLVKKSVPYKAVESCLSLEGERPTTRYRKITVRFFDEKFKRCEKSYTDFTAQIIQHELDHLQGILI